MLSFRELEGLDRFKPEMQVSEKTFLIYSRIFRKDDFNTMKTTSSPNNYRNS